MVDLQKKRSRKWHVCYWISLLFIIIIICLFGFRKSPDIASAHLASSPATFPLVEIAEGTHKYVQIRAQKKGTEKQVFVTSKANAKYHRHAAKPFLAKLNKEGYLDVNVVGGGRLTLDSTAKAIFVYGYSSRYGQADHSKSRTVILDDARYRDYNVTISNQGY
jgi:phosphohistidine phosphatase